MCMRILYSQPEHRSRCLSRMKDALDLAFEFEEVFLFEGNLLHLQLNGLLYDCLQILVHFFCLSRVKCLIDVTAIVEYLKTVFWLAL